MSRLRLLCCQKSFFFFYLFDVIPFVDVLLFYLKGLEFNGESVCLASEVFPSNTFKASGLT